MRMPEIRQISDGVFVRTANRDLTNTTILISGRQALLIDPAWEPADLDELVDWLRTKKLTVVAGFSTHAHHDHVLWHPGFGRALRWASAVTAERAAAHRVQLIAGLGRGWPPDLLNLVGRLTATDAATLDWPDTVELIRHDAHTPGHTALWLPGAGVLVAGDMLSDVEPPLPEETGPGEYLAGLQILKPYVSQATIVIPGHGNPGTDARVRWRRDWAAASQLV